MVKRIQSIQQKVPIGSKVTFTLKTEEKVSGVLTEIALDHITVAVGNRQKTIFEEAILMFDIQDSETEEAYSTDFNAALSESVSKQVAVSHTIEPNTELSEPVPEQVETLETVDANTNTKPSESVSKQVAVSHTIESNAELSEPFSEQVEASETVDTNTETTKPVSDQVEVSNRKDSKVESTEHVDFEEQASEKLTKIVTRYNTAINTSTIELKLPDLTFPASELTGWQNTGIAGRWDQIKNKYEYAKKINELSSKFGRVRTLLTDLRSIGKHFPNSPSLKRIIAYFYAVSDDWQEAIQLYQEVASTSDDSDDWFNVAVSAMNLNKKELVCYGLERFFNGVSVINESNAWYIYVNLIEKFNSLSVFRELCQKVNNEVAENEINVLLDAALYLFKRKVTTELAIEILQKRIKGESAESLLKEVSQKLGGPSVESYRQFLSELMNERIASEKRDNSIDEGDAKSFDNTKLSVNDMESQKPNSLPRNELIDEELYREAQRADKIDKNLVKAEQLYQECISQNIRHDSAIKDLAMVLVRLDRPEEAVELLEERRSYVKDKQSLDNTLIAVYPAASQYEKAIDLLNNSLELTSEEEKRALIRLQIASNYLKLSNYLSAENQFRQVLKLHTYKNNIPVQRNLALCLSKRGNYDDAGKILNQIQKTSSDAKTAELLEAVESAQRTGEFILDDDRIIEIEAVLSYFSGELSDFAQFFLDRCAFDGISPERVNEGKYTGSEKDFRYDIGRLEDVARQLGTKRARDRSHYYLSAARIYFDLGSNQNSFYRYLCRSFASRGDAAVSENKHLDTVREWYCEALAAYDGDKTPRKGKSDEQDAVNSLVRYLYSTLGHVHIDLTPNTRTFKKVLTDVIDNHPDKKKVFASIAYLVLHSRFAADRVLNRLYDNESLRAMAIEYLQEMDIDVPDVMGRLVDFVRPWDELRNHKSNAARTTSDELRLLNNFDLTTSWLEDNIRFAEDIRSSLFFELDRQRVGELQRILKTALELCKQVTFEERERLCFQLRSFCQDLLRDIEESPTKLSVEDVYPITEIIQEKVDSYLNELYVTSKPELNLRLPKESYVPDTDQKIEVQIVLENERGQSPAESLELIVQEDNEFFSVSEPNIKQNESLRGGEQSILTVPLRVTSDALQSQTFSLSLCVQYRTRTEEQVQTPIQNFSIRLYSKDEFEKIANPYATYAEGGIVGDAEMFFGREELIQNIAQAIQESRTQSKSVMVFGQKRSGKSSVLYHLKESLKKDEDLLILDLENIAAILGENSDQDENSRNSLLNQILKSILTEFQYAVEDRIDEGYTPLNISTPSDQEFYSHPNPQQCFIDIFKSFKSQTSKQEDWRGVRVVLLIDEFQYIYDLIVDGKISKSFMKSWKAFLQANYFHTVLVGQDVMPKFKARFPNEFGTTQDERVTYLKPDDARELIDEPIRIGGRHGESRYREQAIERILDLTAGSPFYIQIICNRLVEYMNVKHAGLVTEADVDQVKNELIRDVNALGLDKFDNLINSGDTSPDAISDEDVLKVLKIIANNSNKTDPCPQDKIVCQTNSPIDTILDDLEKRDVVKRRDQSYQIQVGLFREWLIENR